ncbi:MAG: hypothetical protein WD341_08895 [Tistlia sp.]|uniref:hypothetical protein n=1 Tax=Tistlia sp. TaxID=3057121 RepID=UPI0034A56524
MTPQALLDPVRVVARRHWPAAEAPGLLARLGLGAVAAAHRRKGYDLERFEGSLTARGHLRLIVRWAKVEERGQISERRESCRAYDCNLGPAEFVRWSDLLRRR